MLANQLENIILGKDLHALAERPFIKSNNKSSNL